MLYIFHVDTGTMMTFDMNLALESVSHLQTVIDNQWRIPSDKQVLLVSGGESLDPNARVCSYSAGTDTNPIYLFSKSVIESTNPPTPSIDLGADLDLKEQVEASSNMPATYSTVVARAQLAQQFHELAREQTKICEKLVHDQHLQQQGWAAVVANLEDITAEFKIRSEKFQLSFKQYMDMRVSYLEFLQNFNNDLKTLSKIPILPALQMDDLITEETKTAICDSRTAEPNIVVPSSLNNSSSHDKNITLLQWISSADNQSSLDQVAEQCSRGLEQLDGRVVETLCTEVRTALDSANNGQMKEVKGLGDRLYGLEQLMCESKRYVQEQSDLAQAFLQNQNRASNLGDASILPDLCASHRRQLLVMLENHQRLRDIRRRCTRAKEELSVNLYHRLKWIMYVENLILETDHKLMIYHESLKRLRRHVEIIQQIHLAPAMYLNAVAEVVRRRAFSQAFLLWASELACHILTIHNDEVSRRKDFQTQFEGHFLNSLFPGMDDLPPSFATQAPSIFDSRLPKLTTEDIEKLKSDLPDLTQTMSAPDMSAIAQFFFVKSVGEKDKVDERGVEEKLVQAVTDVGLASNLDQGLLKPAENEPFLSAHAGLPHLKDLDKGCESETDTEEFEKVGQSPLELQFESKNAVSLRPGTHDASTLTEVGGHTSFCIPPKKPPRMFLKSTIVDTQAHKSKTPQNTPKQSQSLAAVLPVSPCREHNIQTVDKNETDIIPYRDSNLKTIETDFIGKEEIGFMRKSISLTSPPTQCSSKLFCPEFLSPSSPCSSQGHPQALEFVTDEFYIDESMPSSLSIEGTTQSQGELSRQLEQANNVIALFQDNLTASKTESDKLKSLVVQMAVLAREAMNQLRTELTELRSQLSVERGVVRNHCCDLTTHWNQLRTDCETRERESLQRLTVDHELEQSDLKKLIQCKVEEIQCLRIENHCLEESLLKAREENRTQKDEYERLLQQEESSCDALRKRVNEFEEEKEKAVKEAKDILTKEYKAELESIRSRFKLLPLKDRSPSDSSLEKIDHNVIDISKHSEIVQQLRDDLAMVKEKSVIEAVLEERARWEAKLEQELTHSRIRNEQEKQVLFNEAMRRVVDEKEKQIECLREREAALNLECIKYKNTIQQLTESEIESNSSILLERVEALERDKCQLEAELSVERTKRFGELPQGDLAASVAVYEGKCDAATSPTRMRDKLTRSQTSLIQAGRINIASCNTGDPVLVVWDTIYQNYVILQESSVLYFLHSDCVEMLGLKPASYDLQRKLYSTAEVLEKEYCHARKAENRYHVPKGTKFYRIKVKPLPHSKDLMRSQHPCCTHASILASMSQSQTNEQASSVILTTVIPESQSVPTSPTKDASSDMSSSQQAVPPII